MKTIMDDGFLTNLAEIPEEKNAQERFLKAKEDVLFHLKSHFEPLIPLARDEQFILDHENGHTVYRYVGVLVRQGPQGPQVYVLASWRNPVDGEFSKSPTWIYGDEGVAREMEFQNDSE